MSKKKHFIERRLASSNNYEASRRIRKAYLIRHPEDALEIEQSRTHIRLPFAMICGKRVEMSISEANIHTSIKINWE